VNLLGTNLALPAAIRNDKVQFAEIYPVPLSTREPLPGIIACYNRSGVTYYRWLAIHPGRCHPAEAKVTLLQLPRRAGGVLHLEGNLEV